MQHIHAKMRVNAEYLRKTSLKFHVTSINFAFLRQTSLCLTTTLHYQTTIISMYNYGTTKEIRS